MTIRRDPNGQPMTIGFNGSEHFFLYNAQGDVVAIANYSGQVVVEYTYDAWGNPLSCTGSLADTLGKKNPFRYRGYVYDEETGLYYLKSRYYDPRVGRFICGDSYATTGQGLLSSNIFAYCAGNPVNFCDPNGHFWEELGELIKNAFQAVGNTISSWRPAYAAVSSFAILDGPIPAGDVIALGGVGLLTLGAIGYTTYKATKNALSRSQVNAKSETKDNTETVIYRYNGTNPGNLTPKEKDLVGHGGLSFSTIPRPNSAKTTIEALNATGVVYAVQDGRTHVSVYPVGGTLQDWVIAGPNSIWTRAVKSVVVKWDGGK